MKRILIYGPYNNRARDIESLAVALRKKGHEVFFVTQLAGDGIIEQLQREGITAVSTGIRSNRFVFKWLREIWFVMKFCKRNRIDVLFSHLEPAHIVSVFAQHFINTRVIICRHHVDEIELVGGSQVFSYKAIYRLGKEFVVVSERTKQYMIEKENVPAEKIRVINLLFDFKKFPQPDFAKVEAIRKEANADLILLTACRLVKFKRPELSVEVLKVLVDKGLNAHLIILGHGELDRELELLIETYNLKGKCTLAGYKPNVIDYLEACNVLLHPSILDSSSMIIKEAGLRRKLVIGCRGIGLLDDKLVNEENGFLTDSDNFVAESVAVIHNYFEQPHRGKRIGDKLHDDVLNYFSVENRIHDYDFIG